MQSELPFRGQMNKLFDLLALLTVHAQFELRTWALETPHPLCHLLEQFREQTSIKLFQIIGQAVCYMLQMKEIDECKLLSETINTVKTVCLCAFFLWHCFLSYNPDYSEFKEKRMCAKDNDTFKDTSRPKGENLHHIGCFSLSVELLSWSPFSLTPLKTLTHLFPWTAASPSHSPPSAYT